MDSSVDLIIISVTPTKTLEVINSIKELWNTKITITETSSVKNHLIFKNINNIVFSHPIAGSDKSGIDNSDANLFTYKKNIICKSSNTDQFHLDRLKSFWENALMMNVAEMSIKEHDQIFAITSHLPHLLAYALIDSIRLSGINICFLGLGAFVSSHDFPRTRKQFLSFIYWMQLNGVVLCFSGTLLPRQ